MAAPADLVGVSIGVLTGVSIAVLIGVPIGVPIGVLMSIGHVCAEEAMRAGAILPPFQRHTVAAKRTDLLETAPVPATRCAHSWLRRVRPVNAPRATPEFPRGA